MATITIRTIDGEMVTLEGPEALRAEIMKYEQAIDLLVPRLESDDDAEAEEAESLYGFALRGLEMINSALPAFNQEIARERRHELAARLRDRKKPKV